MPLCGSRVFAPAICGGFFRAYTARGLLLLGVNRPADTEGGSVMWENEDRRLFARVRTDLVLRSVRLVVRVVLYALLGYLVVEFDLLKGVPSYETSKARAVEVAPHVHAVGR